MLVAAAALTLLASIERREIMKETPLKLKRTATYMNSTGPKSGFDGYRGQFRRR